MIDEVQRTRVEEELVFHGKLPRHFDGSAHETPPTANRQGQDVCSERRAESGWRGHRDPTAPVVDGHDGTAQQIVAYDSVGVGPSGVCRAGNRREAQIDVFYPDSR